MISLIKTEAKNKALLRSTIKALEHVRARLDTEIANHEQLIDEKMKVMTLIEELKKEMGV